MSEKQTERPDPPDGPPTSITTVEDLEALLLWFIDWAEANDHKLPAESYKDGYRYLRKEHQEKSADRRPEKTPLVLPVNTAADLHKLLDFIGEQVKSYDHLPPIEDIIREAQDFVLVELMGREPDADETQQIVINTDFGGFGLSDTALEMLHEDYGWKIGSDERIRESTSGSKDLSLCRSYDRELRTDPDLIEVVEQLGEDAASTSAELAIVEVPVNVEWERQEYDGKEWIAEAHRTWP